jgi:hypothetical protein
LIKKQTNKNLPKNKREDLTEPKETSPGIFSLQFLFKEENLKNGLTKFLITEGVQKNLSKEKQQ